ncbi:ATP-binding protein [Seohaeicola nanhaiensis]|uniref:histidine kinase n=1 Tax=Seohaeicola nanhaiensis TaxID=1387282 RepID=A0ABV9KCX0_9RHOB
MDVGSTQDPAMAAPVTPAREFEDFIYLVSHDVRSSVRALIELPQWIEEDLRAEGVRIGGSLAENLALMNTHMRRLDRMLIDLLIYSRIGRMQSGGDIDWNEVIDDVLEQTRMPPGFHLVRDIQAPTMRMGRNDAVTLVSSLLSNGVKHHDRPQGTLRIATREENSWVRLDVIDDGPGIPKESRSKVFEVMTTLKPRDLIEGSGMGLANVRKIVSHYGGRLEWRDTGGTRGCHLAVYFQKTGQPLH